MKRLFLTLFTLTLISVSFVQLRLTTAQEGGDPSGDAQLRVVSDQVAGQLSDIGEQLDGTDPTTQRFQSLLGGPSGKIAIVGYLSALQGRARDDARAEAIPRFAEQHFTRDSSGDWTPRPESKASLDRWIRQSERLAENIDKMKATMNDMAARMDTSTEAGGLFKRLLQDPQAPVAVLMFEMPGGGDVVSRYIAEALDKILVDRGDGNFTIVESKRQDAETQIELFELASKISVRLKRDLPVLAAEYSSEDEAHKELVSYLQNPLTATVAAIQLASDDSRSAAEAVEKLHEQFEKASADTASGLKIVNDEAWPQLKEIYGRVDRAASILPRIQERLAEVAETMSSDDPLAARLASQMIREPIAVMLAAELPYAEADPGEQLRALLSEVMTSSGDKLSINRDREDEVTAKARELLQVCRKIRRHVGRVDEMLDELADRQLVEKLGPAGRFVVLDQVRQFAERHRPDPIALMREDLLAETGEGKLRVREDRREIVRRLVEESEKVQAEAAKDDF